MQRVQNSRPDADKLLGFFGDCAAEKVALRADLTPAQSSKKRRQLSAVSRQLRPLEPTGSKHRKFFCDVFALSGLTPLSRRDAGNDVHAE